MSAKTKNPQTDTVDLHACLYAEREQVEDLLFQFLGGCLSLEQTCEKIEQVHAQSIRRQVIHL